MVRDTGAHSGGSSDSAGFFFFEPGLWLKMSHFQITLPFNWLCKALSRFPAHIRGRAGSVSLQNKHMGCKSCDSEDSPAIFLSAVAIGNRALQNTIYPGMQGETELSKGTPVNPFLAKKPILCWSQQKLLLALFVCRLTNKPAPCKWRQTTKTLTEAPGTCSSTGGANMEHVRGLYFGDCWLSGSVWHTALSPRGMG